MCKLKPKELFTLENKFNILLHQIKILLILVIL